MKYLQIHKFPFKNVIFLDIDQNILENSSKTCLLPGLVAFPNGPSAPIGRIENFAKSLPLSTKRKLSILLDFPFPTAPFSGVFFNLEKINTGLVNHRMRCLMLFCLTFEDFFLGLTFSVVTLRHGPPSVKGLVGNYSDDGIRTDQRSPSC